MAFLSFTGCHSPSSPTYNLFPCSYVGTIVTRTLPRGRPRIGHCIHWAYTGESLVYNQCSRTLVQLHWLSRVVHWPTSVQYQCPLVYVRVQISVHCSVSQCIHWLHCRWVWVLPLSTEATWPHLLLHSSMVYSLDSQES